MKHLKAINQKAQLLEQAVSQNKVEDVVAMSSVVGCASTFDPGRSTLTSKVRSESPRESLTTDLADARVLAPPTSRSATK